jgi:hypothetical protein
MRQARTNGGVRIRSGCKPSSDPALSREESRLFNERLNATLGTRSAPRRLKHFSHFDAAMSAKGPEVSPEQACQSLAVLIGQCVASEWKGVRPQLAKALVVIAQMAKRDGYSLRVVAETAVNTL